MRKTVQNNREPLLVCSLSFLAVMSLFILCFDQISKYFIRKIFVIPSTSSQVIPGVIRFEYVQNTGAAFGSLSGAHTLFLCIAAFWVVGSVAYVIKVHKHSWLELTSLSLLIGGALGNALDRIMFGYVTDFISFSFVDFPVFNIADIAICLGAMLLIVSMFFMHDVQEPVKQIKEP